MATVATTRRLLWLLLLASVFYGLSTLLFVVLAIQMLLNIEAVTVSPNCFYG